MSPMTRIIIHLFSTLLMLACFLFMLSAMVTNHWRGGEHENVTDTKYYEGLLKRCHDGKEREGCVDVHSHDKSDDITTDRNIVRAVLSAAIFFAIFGFGWSVLALCQRARTKHVLFQVFVILSLIISFCCGIGSLMLYKKNFDAGPVTFPSGLTVQFDWQYSWGLAWTGAILVIVPLAIAIFDAITFPKDEYEAA